MRIPALPALLLLAMSWPALADVPSHCTKSERVVWSCRAGAKVYSVCASGVPDAAQSLWQYRAGKPGVVELRHPEVARPPAGVFQFAVLPRGASLSFRRGGYLYDMREDIGGETLILVSGAQRSGTVKCGDSTMTLTLTSSIEAFEAAGIKE